MRVLAWATLICRRIARLISLAVSLLGLLSLVLADLRQDALLMGLFFILPVLSFPITLLSFRWLRLSVALQWVLAFGYLAVYSRLDWRTCSGAGYCQGAMATVLVTLTAWPVQVLFAVAVFNLAFLCLSSKARPA
jgi:hypothetical protein